MNQFFNLSPRLATLLRFFLVTLGVLLNIYVIGNFFESHSLRHSVHFRPILPESTSISKLSQAPITLHNTTPISTKSSNTSSLNTLSKFGHLPYTEANPKSLVTISSYGQREYQRFESLMPDAAFSLMKMIYAARDEGVWIVPASGFRGYLKQQEIFDRQAKIKGSIEKAAKSSAPPGYSEHHTGFAIDLADGHVPEADINSNFESTEAFVWLTSHAQEFGFELSFPKNNIQGVKYEPWHWRFINSLEAIETFKNAKTSG
ncbi:M15 family metallopeptidase [Leptothoe sp. LEGE 181152]|nr:M15 family metallopeptidase [Leptothoe sp. LEGE 181152]